MPRGRHLIGKPRGYSNNKEGLCLFMDQTVKKTRNLYIHELTKLTKETMTDDGNPSNDTLGDQNLRESRNIELAGFRLMMEVTNINSDNDPIICHYLVCTHKTSPYMAAEYAAGYGYSTDSAVAALAENDNGKIWCHEFFNDRTTNKDFTSFSREFGPMVNNYYPVNTRKLNILARKQFTLNHPDLRTTQFDTPGTYARFRDQHTSSNKNSYRHFKWWIPIRRQVGYRDDTANSCNNKIFLLMWFEKATGGAADVAVDAVNQSIYGHINFQDTK